MIYPQNLYDQIIHIIKNYPNYHKIYITKNNLKYKNKFIKSKKTIHNNTHINYIKQHLNIITNTIKNNTNIKNYFI